MCLCLATLIVITLSLSYDSPLAATLEPSRSTGLPPTTLVTTTVQDCAFIHSCDVFSCTEKPPQKSCGLLKPLPTPPWLLSAISLDHTAFNLERLFYNSNHNGPTHKNGPHKNPRAFPQQKIQPNCGWTTQSSTASQIASYQTMGPSSSPGSGMKPCAYWVYTPICHWPTIPRIMARSSELIRS